MGKLTALAIKAAFANPGTYSDGDGLMLRVDKRGGAYWVLRLQRDGKRQDIGLGSAKVLSLADARDEATKLRKAVKVDRRDVLAEKKDEAEYRQHDSEAGYNQGFAAIRADNLAGATRRTLSTFRANFGAKGRPSAVNFQRVACRTPPMGRLARWLSLSFAHKPTLAKCSPSARPNSANSSLKGHWKRSASVRADW